MSDVNDVEYVRPEVSDAENYGPFIMCIEDSKVPPTKGVLLSELVRTT